MLGSSGTNIADAQERPSYGNWAGGIVKEYRRLGMALFYADDVALLSASAQGLQQLLDSMQSFCAANGLTISIPKTEIVVFGGGHHDCVWKVAGQHLERSKSFT